MLIKFFLNLLSKFIGLFPINFWYFIAEILSYLCFNILHIRQAVILKNLTIVFGNSKSLAEKKYIGRKSVANFGKTLFEVLGSPKYFPQAKFNFVTPENLNNLIDKKQGCYVICMHLSNWEIMCYAAAKYFAPVSAIVKPVGGKHTAEWVKNRRLNYGMQEITKASVRAVFNDVKATLKANKLLGIIVDQRRSRGIDVPFFKENSKTNVSLFRFWKHLPAPVLPIFIHRTGKLQFQMHFLPEFSIENNPSWNEDEFLLNNTINMHKIIEPLILAHPEDYFWMHDRWKS